jgi:predicted DNA-binding WGR domain protein
MRIDSERELDLVARLSETQQMTHSFHLVRCDSSRNMARFYRLELGRTLFGEVVLTRRWGRIGTEGRSQETLVTNQSVGVSALQEWHRRKQRRGYLTL